jgi:hypothetical protein
MAKVYRTEKEIADAIAKRNARFAKAKAKGSTGENGKRFESDERITYKRMTGQNLYRDDFKAKDLYKVDMFVFINGKKRRVECKTGRGALVYCNVCEDAWKQLEKLTRSTNIIVWKAYDDEPPFCFIMGDLLKALAQYKGKGLDGWFEYCPQTEKRSGQIQFRPFKSEVKKKFLFQIAHEIGYDWETVKQTGCLE